MADKIGYLILFLSLVAVILAVGLLLGILVAGRIDRRMTVSPKPTDSSPEAPAAGPAEDDHA